LAMHQTNLDTLLPGSDNVVSYYRFLNAVCEVGA
jgi:hypothetical protein